MRVNNRPWAPPREPWIMLQEWHELLFAHWPVPFDVLRPLVPAFLPLDSYDDLAWVGVTPFTLSGLRARWLPPIPGLSRFPEINVRTYVTLGGKPGVFFFSLDAGSRVAVLGARLSYSLPYFFTKASVERHTADIVYRSARNDKRGANAVFDSHYRPVGPVFHAQPGTGEYFLTERYCLYSIDSQQRVWRAEIDHEPWPLQNAEAQITQNTMASAANIPLPSSEPCLHFSRFIAVRVWRPVRVAQDELQATATSEAQSADQPAVHASEE